jgi:lipoate-protein ligase B
MSAPLEVIDLGQRGYHDTLALQRSLRLARLDGREPHDLLLLVEHEPVYTLGRGTREASLPLPPAALRERGATVAEVERGGDVTWHGPGQLVGYPILDLRRHRADLHWYLRTLEQALVGALGALGLAAGPDPGRTGVWTDGRKIASIGIHVKQWVTLHGFALNVDPDLAWFDAIVPCGLTGVTMTSVARELGGDRARWWMPTRAAVIAALGEYFALAPRIRAEATAAAS